MASQLLFPGNYGVTGWDYYFLCPTFSFPGCCYFISWVQSRDKGWWSASFAVCYFPDQMIIKQVIMNWNLRSLSKRIFRFWCCASCRVLVLLPAIVSIPKLRYHTFYIDLYNYDHCYTRTCVDSLDMVFCDFQTDPVVALLHCDITTPVETYCIIWKRIGVMVCKRTTPPYSFGRAMEDL